jgi:hypothetical protein
MMREVPVSLLVKIPQYLVTEFELLRNTIVSWCLGLPHLFRSIGVREVFGRRRMNLPLGTTRFLITSDDRY